MALTRRNLLKVAPVVVAGLPVRSWASDVRGEQSLLSMSARVRDPLPADLAARAVDAAIAAGASYADVRLTFTDTEFFRNASATMRGSARAVGVRVLVDGIWGYLGSAVWTVDEMARLAHGAVAQARAANIGRTRPAELGKVPVAKGEWIMPVKYDPFTIPLGEKMDVMNAIHDFVSSYSQDAANVQSVMDFRRQQKIFASSEGAAWSQTTFVTAGDLIVGYRDQAHLSLSSGSTTADFLSPAGRGWEYIAESGAIDEVPRLLDLAEQARHVKPVEVNRYDAVFSAQAMASLLDVTIGGPTELDRALGYEANAAGTSYLDEPLDMLGTYKIGAPLLNVTANRSQPGGAATVKWDDESVVPNEFTLVRDGTLVDYQTTREQAAWLAPYYQKKGIVPTSHGCAMSESALSITMQQSPNLHITPGTRDLSFEDLVAATDKGVAIQSLFVRMDHQMLNGAAYPVMREINKGKLGNFLRGGVILFRAPDFWKTLSGLGGSKSLRWYGTSRRKGQPVQETTHSVGAVPGKFINVAVADAARRA